MDKKGDMEMKLTKAAMEILSKMEYRFYHVDNKGNGYTYYSDGYILFRYPGKLESVPLDQAKERDFTFLFHESYDYQAEKKAIFKKELKGKERVLFSEGKQLVSAYYIRQVFAILGSCPIFFPSMVNRWSPVYVTNDPCEPGWEAIILPMRYDERAVSESKWLIL